MKKKEGTHICKQTSFRACDWLLFLFTIITLGRSYDEIMTILWSSYDCSKIGIQYSLSYLICDVMQLLCDIGRIR